MTGYVVLDHKGNHDKGNPLAYQVECRCVNGQWYGWSEGRKCWMECEEWGKGENHETLNTSLAVNRK